MMMAALGSTKPEAGVMATRPATPPATAPTTLGVPLCSQLTVIHVRAAMPAAVFVTTNAFAAVPLAARADPPLKPNQPNQSSPAPITVRRTSWGSKRSDSRLTRGPRTRAATSAATPELMWTTVPPAKSIAPILPSQPPRSEEHTSELQSRQYLVC